MGKVKAKMMEKEYDLAFPMTQATLFEGPDLNGFEVTELQPKNLYEQAGNGLPLGNNFYSPSTTETTSSAASKPATLILNGQAKRNTTTKAKSPKAGQFTDVQDALVAEKLKKALAEMKKFYAEVPVAF